MQIQFGQSDWMDFNDTVQTIRDKKMKAIKVEFIDNADHQITFQNPI